MNISKIQQINYTVKTIPLYSCSACTLTELPFYNKRNLNETIDNETQITPPSRDFHIDKLQANFNINLLSHQNESTNRYKNILHTFSLKQHVTKSTRKGKTLIDLISSNISTKLIHCNVISTDEISDHDNPYVIFSIKKERFQKRYTYVRVRKT